MNTVRRSLAMILVLGAVLVALVGGVGAVSAFNAASAVDRMVDTIRPAAVAARDMRHQAVVAGASIRAFALSGDQAELDGYRDAVTKLGNNSDDLASYLSTHPAQAALHRSAITAFSGWVEHYVEPRMASGGGPDSFRRDLYLEGQSRFQQTQAALTEFSRSIEQDYATVREQLHGQLRAAVVLIAVTALVGIIMMAVLGRWIAGSIQNPLNDLATTVRRLRDGETTVRAQVVGPAEVREVAAAVNELAAENGRAREMEDNVQRELRQIDRMRTEFVSNVSHELRTPLTIISGNLELLDDSISAQSAEYEQRLLASTRRNVSRLNDLIEDLLALNSAEHSGTTLDLVDFQAVVAEVAGDMSIAAASRGLRLVHRPKSRRPIVVLGDANQLRRAVLNLVSNAVKFSHADGEVRLDVTTDERSVTLRVIDRGLGIPSNDLERIGGRFFRASNALSNQIAGTGLGLRIVTTIINNHHGTLALASEEGVGTTATIVLPLADPAETARPEETSPGPGGEQTPGSAG